MMKWHNVKKIGKIFCYSIIVLVVMLILVSLAPIKNNYHLFIVKSGSMEPTIKTGSLILTLPQADYKIDDIISYKLTQNNNEILVTHRIVEVEYLHGQYWFITQGDANNAPDSNPIIQNQIIGKLVFKIPYIGYPLNYLQTQIGVIIIIAFASIITYREILKIHREITLIKQRGNNAKLNKNNLLVLKTNRIQTIIKKKSVKKPDSKSKNKIRNKNKSVTKK